MTTQKSLLQREEENQIRLIHLLALRRTGQTRTTSFKALRKLALKEYRRLTTEKIEFYKSQSKIAVYY